MPATRRLILIILALLLVLLFLVVPGVSWSQTPQAGPSVPAPQPSQTPASPWQEPAREFAKKIVALTGQRQTVSLTVRNICSLSESEVAAVRAALETELRAAGLRLAAKNNSAPELRVTLSENLLGLLWIAEFLRGDSHNVAMISLLRMAGAPVAATQTFTLQSTLVYEQDEPILDFGLSAPKRPSESKLFVLESSRLAMYALSGGAWKLIQSAELPQPAVTSRDPVADLRLNEKPSFWLYVAGYQCGGSQESLQMTCTNLAAHRDASSPQKSEISPRIVPGRNFYENPGLSENEHPLFYAEMWLHQDGRTVLVKAGLDGGAWILRQAGAGADEATKLGWGSQLGILRSGCGRGAQLLITTPGDWTESDSIQAVEFDGLQPINVTAPLLMPGPVLKLGFDWSLETGLALVHNLKTNRYEAYTLTLSCGR